MKAIYRSMFRSLIIFSFSFLYTPLSAQDQKEKKDQTYVITENGSVTDVQPYIDALNNSDMRYHRLLNSRYTIVFQTGLKVELFSANEISQQGLPIQLSDYPENFSASRQEPVFALGANNYIIQYHTAGSKHHQPK